MMPTVGDLLLDHVALSNSCVDRLYINGYQPGFQTSGGLCNFLRTRRGAKIASPAILKQIRDQFVKNIDLFTKEHDTPIIHFERGQRKDDIATEHRAAFEAEQGVVFVGVAQERALSFKGSKQVKEGKIVDFDFSRQSVYVNHYYFYLQDRYWGPAFIKICSYFPYAIKLCLNGHEWAKQQLRREGIGFESLDNGFLSCEHPDKLQQICDDLGPSHILRFFQYWSRRLPWPLTLEDRDAGWEHRLSIWQMETSLTQVFERPVQGRQFFEAVIRENIDLGRPDRVSLVFPTRHNKRTPPPRGGYRTRIVINGVHPSLHVEYKKSHIKQYFKEQRALRTETTVNDTEDFHIRKDISHMDEIRDKSNTINQKLLKVERVSQDCVLDQDELDRIQQPTVERGQRASALPFGNQRVLALMQALCLLILLPIGFRNKDLRQHVADLLGLDLKQYGPGQMTYDLRRLRLKGLIQRATGSYRYELTDRGLRIAYFYSKVQLRIMRTGFAAIDLHGDAVPRPLRTAFTRLDKEIMKLCDSARLESAQ